MAVPFFTVKALCRRNGVVVLKGDHEYYRIMSRKVMKCLHLLVPEVEVSSIDEAYLHLTGIHKEDPVGFSRQVRNFIKEETGIPVSIGIGNTKTLAKAAGYIAKREELHEGVFWISSEEVAKEVLKRIPIEEVWGIGRKTAGKLRSIGLTSGYDLFVSDEKWILENFPALVWSTWKELRGVVCYPFTAERQPRKSIQIAPSFRHPVRELEEIWVALLEHVEEAALILRKEKLLCKSLQVSLHTNPYRTDLPQYNNSANIKLKVPSDCTHDLVEAAKEALEKIYKRGYLYRKVGLTLKDLIPRDMVQVTLFEEEKRKKKRLLMDAVDQVVNFLGKDALRLAATKTPRESHPMEDLKKFFPGKTPWDEGYALGVIRPCRNILQADLSDLEKLFKRFKHKAEYKAVKEIAALLAPKLLEISPHILVFVPPFGGRNRKEPLEILAEELTIRTRVPLAKEAFIKKRPVPELKKIPNPKERFNAVSNAYGFSKSVKVQGKRIVLLDDVVRSGASIFEASRVLKQEGRASWVAVLVLAVMQ
jgi:DNA polymerase V